MIVYTVIAHRGGDDNNHSYLVGVYSNPVRAVRWAIVEEYWRGGKYVCDIVESYINEQVYPELGDADEKYDYLVDKCLPFGTLAGEISKRMKEEGLS